MARVIQGIPVSWDSSIANRKFHGEICAISWSPCSRFIAAAWVYSFSFGWSGQTGIRSSEIVVLDAVTLEQLPAVYLSQKKIFWQHIIFSPDSQFLTATSWKSCCISSWDLQTGGLLSDIGTWKDSGLNSRRDPVCGFVSYSGCGTMIGVSSENNTIIIYNVLDGTQIHSHTIQQSILNIIWTHGECLQFATIGSGSITTWEVSFTSNHPPKKVGSLPTPDDFSSNDLVFLPTLSRLAFILDEKVLVWDAQHQKVLLNSADIEYPRSMSFSPDGQFFACGGAHNGLQIWKEAPTGYLPYQKLISGTRNATPLISPDGKSFISHSYYTLQLWHIDSSPTSLPSILPHYIPWFFIEFSPDDSLVAVAERFSSTVTVLDTTSGNPWFAIDTSTKACGLKMTGDKIFVVGYGKIITWDLPARDCSFNTSMDISNSVQTTTLNNPVHASSLYASISPNLNYVAFGCEAFNSSERLCIYSMQTGEKLAVAKTERHISGFTSSGCEVWCAGSCGEAEWWKVIEKNGLCDITLVGLEKNMIPQDGVPWLSPYGYQVTNDGWILCSSGKRVLWLPHHWRQSKEIERKWSEKFLAIWNMNSYRPYILKLEV